jgi:hypothetical protein
MDIGRAFKFIFDDPRWFTKLLIGGLLLLVPVVNFFGFFVVAGYALLLTRRVMDGYDTPLPEWDDLGSMALLGLKSVAAHLIWALPLAASISLLSMGAVDDDGGLLALGILATVGLSIAWALVLPAVSAHFAATESISAAIDWKTIASLVRANIGDYVVLIPLGIVVALIGQAGSILFVIGLVLTMPWAVLASAHLWGQAYFRSRAVLAMTAPAALPPLPAPPSAMPAAVGPPAPVAARPLPPLEP